MPYTEYPIRYTNTKLGYEDRKLYAQTLESTAFFRGSDRSYGYYTSEDKPVLNPTATDSPVPLAPWFPFDGSDTSAKRWGLNAASINNLLAHLKPGLKISTYSSTKASDIALAGTRPVNTENLTVTIPPGDFYPNATEYSAIDIVIYVSPKKGTTPPKLIVQKQCFTSGSTTPYIESTTSNDIPDVPYFVFNFAVCAPGAPSTYIQYSFTDSDGNTLYLNPGGGSGAGAQFTAILSTNPVNLYSSDSSSSQSHTDKITIRYTLAKQSYSSSLVGFRPESISSELDNGIDTIKVTADLHYTLGSGLNKFHFPYLRECTLPGGIIYPGLKASYSNKAKDIINNFISKKGTSELVSSSFNQARSSSEASALIFHKANWMLPEDETSLTNTDANRYQLYQPITVFNPEAIFPSSSTTKIGTSPYTGPAGRPSIFFNGASLYPYEDSFVEFEASAGQRGAGGSGSISAESPPPTSLASLAVGGPFTIILSW